MAVMIAPGSPVDSSIELMESGQELPICRLCSATKIPRSHHCRICGKCILKMDHHCPWIAQCVGQNNHRYFILFLIHLSLGLIVLSFSSRIMQ